MLSLKGFVSLPPWVFLEKHAWQSCLPVCVWPLGLPLHMTCSGSEFHEGGLASYDTACYGLMLFIISYFCYVLMWFFNSVLSDLVVSHLDKPLSLNDGIFLKNPLNK